MFWIQGRFAWPPVLMVLFSTVALLLIDYAWRMVEAPAAVIAGGGAVLLLAGNAAILVLARRR